MNAPRIPSATMAPTERCFWCSLRSVGTQKLYKEDICICLCRVYVISYRVRPFSSTPLGPAVRMWQEMRLHPYPKTILRPTDITKLSVSLHRIQFRAGRGLAVTDWRIFVILPSRPQCCLPPGPPAPGAWRSQPPLADLPDSALEQALHFSVLKITCGNFITVRRFFTTYFAGSVLVWSFVIFTGNLRRGVVMNGEMVRLLKVFHFFCRLWMW